MDTEYNRWLAQRQRDAPPPTERYSMAIERIEICKSKPQPAGDGLWCDVPTGEVEVIYRRSGPSMGVKNRPKQRSKGRREGRRTRRR